MFWKYTPKLTALEATGKATSRSTLAESCPEAEAAQPGSPVLMGGARISLRPWPSGLERELSPMPSLFISSKLAAPPRRVCLVWGRVSVTVSWLAFSSADGLLPWLPADLGWAGWDLLGDWTVAHLPSPSLLRTTWLRLEQKSQRRGIVFTIAFPTPGPSSVAEEMTNAGSMDETVQ